MCKQRGQRVNATRFCRLVRADDFMSASEPVKVETIVSKTFQTGLYLSKQFVLSWCFPQEQIQRIGSRPFLDAFTRIFSRFRLRFAFNTVSSYPIQHIVQVLFFILTVVLQRSLCVLTLKKRRIASDATTNCWICSPISTHTPEARSNEYSTIEWFWWHFQFTFIHTEFYVLLCDFECE